MGTALLCLGGTLTGWRRRRPASTGVAISISNSAHACTAPKLGTLIVKVGRSRFLLRPRSIANGRLLRRLIELARDSL